MALSAVSSAKLSACREGSESETGLVSAAAAGIKGEWKTRRLVAVTRSSPKMEAPAEAERAAVAPCARAALTVYCTLTKIRAPGWCSCSMGLGSVLASQDRPLAAAESALMLRRGRALGEAEGSEGLSCEFGLAEAVSIVNSRQRVADAGRCQRRGLGSCT